VRGLICGDRECTLNDLYGGPGTTGASLRVETPTIICHLQGDQEFWGGRVLASLGVGPSPIPQRKLTAEWLADAIKSVVTDPGLRQHAALLGETIRAEDGVERAVAFIQRQLL